MKNKQNNINDILIAEDSSTQAEELKYILEKHRYKVSVAKNGQEALEMVIKHKPSLLISDIVMPEMNGYDLCRAIKSREESGCIPVILLTSLSQTEDVLEGISCGADHYLTKPFREESLISRVEQILADWENHKREDGKIEVEISIGGKRQLLKAGQQQIFTLLISTYEEAVSKNSELLRTQNELRILNEQLAELLEKKTLALRESETSLIESQKIGKIGSWEYDVEKQSIVWSEVTYELYERDVKLGTPSSEEESRYYSVKQMKMFKDYISEALKEGQTFSFEVQPILPSGKIVHFHTTIHPVKDSLGSVIKLIGTVQDITDRKRAEHELIRLRLGIERSSDAIFMTDTEGVIQYINPAFEFIYGYSFFEAVGQTPQILKSGKNTPSMDKQFWDTTLSKKAVIVEIINKTKDGRFIFVEISNNPILDEQENIIGFMGIHRDITLRKQSEEKEKSLEGQLQQVQKLESIGTLASGIAHDFNNVLAIIMGHTSLLNLISNDAKKVSRSIESITKATQRGAALVKQLLTFARKTETIFESVSINKMILEIEKLLQVTLNKTTIISTSLLQNLPSIVADTGQMHQVLLNLCVNARDAMPNGGTIVISTDVIEAESIQARFLKIDARQYVKIEVADTGTGMDEAIRKRIFEPFFTTKGPGKGTGLGLAVVFGIVEHHKGFIEVQSTVGKGTNFTVYLPIPERALEEIQKEIKDIQEISGGTETILIIEDEVMLMESVQETLVSKGYTVLTAIDGAQGVEMYQRHKNQIAVILSDLGLPLLEGKDVFRKIREINTNAKVIVASGFIAPEAKAEMFKSGLKYFIQKPYSFNEVLQTIRDVIDTHE